MIIVDLHTPDTEKICVIPQAAADCPMVAEAGELQEGKVLLSGGSLPRNRLREFAQGDGPFRGRVAAARREDGNGELAIERSGRPAAEKFFDLGWITRLAVFAGIRLSLPIILCLSGALDVILVKSLRRSRFVLGGGVFRFKTLRPKRNSPAR